jgi:hypothetical protein
VDVGESRSWVIGVNRRDLLVIEHDSAGNVAPNHDRVRANLEASTIGEEQEPARTNH